jgi:hypothetical protein
MKNLIKALSEFQNECPIIHKDTKGHNYTYADLPQIFSVINPLLNKHKLCFTQLLENDGIRTILFHVESGEQLESFTTIPLVKLGSMNEYQSYGAAVSYFRRYCLSSCLGLVTDKDTDAAGQSVSPNVERKKSVLNLSSIELAEALSRCETIESLTKYFNTMDEIYYLTETDLKLFKTRKQQITK